MIKIKIFLNRKADNVQRITQNKTLKNIGKSVRICLRSLDLTTSVLSWKILLRLIDALESV